MIAIVAHGSKSTGNLQDEESLGSGFYEAWTPTEFSKAVLQKFDKEVSMDVVCVQCYGGNFADELRQIVTNPNNIRITSLSYGPVPFNFATKEDSTIGTQLNIPLLEEWVWSNMRYFGC